MENQQLPSAETAAKSIAAAPVNETVRDASSLKTGEVVQQGDIYVTPIDSTHPRGENIGTMQVAVGDSIGSRHIAVGNKVTVFKGEKLPSFFDDHDLNAEMQGPVVVSDGPWMLTHPEHADVSFGAGEFQVCNQVDMKTRERVRD